MFINLNLESSEPIYIQLQQQIIEGIAKKQLQPGDALPSVRSLAADIGINLHTVNKAYQQLKQDGFILIHRQKGVVVHPDGVPQADEEYRQELKAKLRPLIADSICRGLSEVEFSQLSKELFQLFNEEEGEKN
ncbi:GntR family transcriptional regulator [Oceanobacillus profundus]|uniref:GntR family transcriptional regulator n=1 Tax=Oceanobacillus profundus TaxID=372463 RepID=A0A417YAL2_9BACI|nr:GntR family transcriptional regulator [Oceanobacillus profundus]MBR3120239.1 GntR family transcriptional regulator [Oceanobacillus sp.]PAE27464.1 GntR family transcriptional regulator [Paenibacillus sp. 7884-2]RHW29564.1 GntR family transcriptional regulator [Oceanobacillus profundus]